MTTQEYKRQRRNDAKGKMGFKFSRNLRRRIVTVKFQKVVKHD